MTCKTLTVMIALMIVSSSQTIQEKVWKNIVPLHSTRKDVETLLGPPQETRGVAATFQLNDGRLRVFYSKGYCKQPNTNDWNVPPDTVVTLTFEPTNYLLIADLKLDIAKYHREDDPHLQRAVHYYNRESGIRISTRLEKKGEEVQTITYEPTEKDLHLRCQKSLQGVDTRDIYPGLAFDEYGELSFNQEKPRLDNFASYLKKNEPTLLGYIIIYRARGMRSVDAEFRAKRAKNYMARVHSIENKRIVTIMGGCREHLEILLYAIPNSMKPPTPQPNCE